MPQPPLSHHHIRRLRPGRTPVDIRDGLQRGLILTVLPSGRKQFAVRYRFRGTQRRYRLGEFPSLSLAHARKKADAPASHVAPDDPRPWAIPVLKTVARTGEGVPELLDAVDQHREYLDESGQLRI